MKSVQIDKGEILMYLVSRKFRERDPTEEILKAFRLFDDDKDGSYEICTFCLTIFQVKLALRT